MKENFFFLKVDLKNGMTSVLMYHRSKQKHRIDIDVKVKRNEWNLKLSK
jgi:hypothetical protein